MAAAATTSMNPVIRVRGALTLEPEDASVYHFKIPAKCVSKYMSEYDMIKYIKCGVYGCTFQICEKLTGGKLNCKYVVKIFRDEDGTAMDEVKIAGRMGDKGIGPTVKTAWMCDGEIRSSVSSGYSEWQDAQLYFIVMDRMDMPLSQYISEYKKEWQAEEDETLLKIMELYIDMRKLGFAHDDIHPGNIMVNIDSNHRITDVRLIDFGVVSEAKAGMPSDREIDTVLKQLMTYIVDWQR